MSSYVTKKTDAEQKPTAKKVSYWMGSQELYNRQMH